MSLQESERHIRQHDCREQQDNALELDNVRAALAWAGAEHDQREAALNLATSLMRCWRYTGRLNEGCSWLTTLAAGASRGACARAMAAAAYVRDHQGDHRGAWQYITEALPLARELDDPVLLAQVLCTLGRLRLHARDPREAVEALHEALAVADSTWRSYALLNLGFAEHALGRQDQALTHYQDALRIAQNGRTDSAPRWSCERSAASCSTSAT